MPKASGGQEYPSSSRSNLVARENQDTQDVRIEESLLARSESLSLAILHTRNTGAAAARVGVVAGQALPVEPTRAEPTRNDQQRRSHTPLYSVAFEGWDRDLDDLLADFCNRGRGGQREAMLAIRARHPQISSDTIWARIVYLGLTKSKRPPYLRHQWSPEDLELLRAGYSDGRNSASRTINVLLQRHPDWSRSVVCWKAKSLGISHQSRNGHQSWSDDADRQLISCEGFRKESVEKRMKRSRGSIVSRLAVLERGAEFFGGFKTKDLMELLHLDESSVRRLVRQGVLKRELGRITEDSLKSLCREHPEEIPFETLGLETKRKLVNDYDYGTRKRSRQGGRKKKQPATEEAKDQHEPSWHRSVCSEDCSVRGIGQASV